MSEQNIIGQLKQVARNAASRYMAGTPAMTDDSQIIMDAANRIAALESQLAVLKNEVLAWRKAYDEWDGSPTRRMHKPDADMYATDEAGVL